MFKVELKDASKFSEVEKQKLFAAIALWERVWNTFEFRDAVTTFKWEKWTRTGRFFRRRWVKEVVHGFRWTDLDNKELYDYLMQAKEYGGERAGVAEIKIEIDRDNVKGVIGYTYPNTQWQWIYSWFFKEATIAEIANNLAHEFCHKLGFDHEWNYTDERDFTVPYAIGNLTEEIGSKLKQKKSSQE